ncbi:MAG: hypothetical protein RL026_2093 [Pseudomonadota bacterium]|jgi:thiol:disulfide interchange protein DsbC
MFRPALLLLSVVLPLAACGQSPDTQPRAPVAATPGGPAGADEAVPPGDPRIALAAKIPGARPQDLRPSPIAGLYEITHEASVSYISADGRHIVGGDIFAVGANGDFPNLTEKRRNELRLKMLGDVAETEMVVFGDAGLKHTITVFTDVDCQWCRKLHSEIADYNRHGIRVRYLAWPRTGPATESWQKAERVWCAGDKADALARAKRGEALRTAACAGNPVQKHWDLGRKLGVQGTPGLVLETGELLPGYVPAAELASHLDGAAGG